jgi:hypothetical protein
MRFLNKPQVVNARFCLHFYLAYARSGYENNVFLVRNMGYMGVIFLNGQASEKHPVLSLVYFMEQWTATATKLFYLALI